MPYRRRHIDNSTAKYEFEDVPLGLDYILGLQTAQTLISRVITSGVIQSV